MRIKALVRDTTAAKTAYGPYVEPISVDVGNAAVLKRVLRDVRTLVLLGRPGAALTAARDAGVERVVALSSAGEHAALVH